ncbi:unnamed protein product [Cuscuta epithymum]|uniref:Uncharacterized protein n=1 Tax=Cuscuta epithymum TaxID=186058 RepID=A0AAV0G8K9_9ASTE|nr:unnamed protein product [Cuscuta epithymum]
MAAHSAVKHIVLVQYRELDRFTAPSCPSYLETLHTKPAIVAVIEEIDKLRLPLPVEEEVVIPELRGRVAVVMSFPPHLIKVTKSRIIVQTRRYKGRKYGQKVVKGNTQRRF